MVQAPGSGTAASAGAGAAGNCIGDPAVAGMPPPPPPAAIVEGAVLRPVAIDAGKPCSAAATGATSVKLAGSSSARLLAAADSPADDAQLTLIAAIGAGDAGAGRAVAMGRAADSGRCAAARGRRIDRAFCAAGTTAAPIDPAQMHINSFDPTTDTTNHHATIAPIECYGGGAAGMQPCLGN